MVEQKNVSRRVVSVRSSAACAVKQRSSGSGPFVKGSGGGVWELLNFLAVANFENLYCGRNRSNLVV